MNRKIFTFICLVILATVVTLLKALIGSRAGFVLAPGSIPFIP